MIPLTKLNSQAFVLNAELIKFIRLQVAAQLD